MNYQEQFIGVVNTPNLWLTNLLGIEQLQLVHENVIAFSTQKEIPFRLGKRVEVFISEYLKSLNNISLIAENIQIFKGKLTIGEIDFIIKHLNEIIHLELSYKFYLLNPKLNDNQIDCWVGPNNKDSLRLKLDRILTKQFPIINHAQTKEYLNSLNINEKLTQKVLFKGQLFIPLNFNLNKLKYLNKEAVYGYYYNHKELDLLSKSKLYITNKSEWLITPNTNVSWLSYDSFKNKIEEILSENISPMIWIKNSKGILSKAFVVWW